ncbi:hypothetical protein G6F56_000195 [Rhizopus delemar]|nr:hypothetical protein G6F56_000195 [Rhizopus delemar]
MTNLLKQLIPRKKSEANAKRLFVEELTEYIERSSELCVNVSVYKMQRKWDLIKRNFIRADVNIETYAIEESDGSHDVDNRQQDDIDEEDEEIQAARRARARNVNKITSAEERERHADENHIETNDDLSAQGTRMTSAGRNIRRIFGDQQAVGSPSANRRLNRPVNVLLEAQNSNQQQFLNEMRNKTETMTKFFNEQKVKKTNSLEIIGRLT